MEKHMREREREREVWILECVDERIWVMIY